MDFIYLVDLNSYINDDEIKLNDPCVCCLSNRNVLALSNDCCVYILPLEKPNELIPVTLSNSPCVNMCWSDDGLTLLNVYKNGTCNLFNIKVKTRLNRPLQVETNQNLSVNIVSDESFEHCRVNLHVPSQQR